jgi:translation elongation factor EF-G
MIVVNKIDAENVDLPQLLAQIREVFGTECLPINLPAQGGTRVVDCFFNPSGTADFSSVEAAHQALIDQVVEVDEALMARYLEQGEVSPRSCMRPSSRRCAKDISCRCASCPPAPVRACRSSSTSSSSSCPTRPKAIRRSS